MTRPPMLLALWGIRRSKTQQVLPTHRFVKALRFVLSASTKDVSPVYSKCINSTISLYSQLSLAFPEITCYCDL